MKTDLFATVPKHDMLGFWADQTLKADRVADFLHLQKSDVAKVASLSVKSVRYDHRIPSELLERMEEIASVCNLVAEFFAGDAVKTALWFKAKNPLLANVSPRDMIRYGRVEKLRKIVQDALAQNPPASTKDTPQARVRITQHVAQTQ